MKKKYDKDKDVIKKLELHLKKVYELHVDKWENDTMQKRDRRN